MITVKSLQGSVLPQKFIDVIPKECPECGLDTVISETITSLQCANPRCIDKIVMRIRALLKSQGVLGIGEAGIENMVRYYEIQNPMDIFQITEGMILYSGAESVSEKVIPQIQKIATKGMRFWEYVKICQLPGIQTSCQRLFEDCNTPEEVYQGLEAEGVAWVGARLGISDECSLQAMKIYNTILEYEYDLKEHFDLFTINQPSEGLLSLTAVMSDQVGGRFQSKKDFSDYVSERFEGSVSVTFLPSVRQNMDYLIWAGADGSPARYTSKVKKVESWQNKGLDIKIVTAEGFIGEVERLIENGCL